MNSNLLSFTSPSSLNSSSVSHAERSFPPGDNPFDKVYKSLQVISKPNVHVEEDCINRNKLIDLNSPLIVLNKSVDQQERFVSSQILNELIDLNSSDTVLNKSVNKQKCCKALQDVGATSCSYIDIKVDAEFADDSLQLINNSLFDSIDPGRESLLLFKNIDSLDLGRESLGILQPDFPGFKFSDSDLLTVPEIHKANVETVNQNVSSPLNTAFLLSNSYANKSSALMSTSSYNSTGTRISFNSCSLLDSEPSKIYTLSSLTGGKSQTISSKSDLNMAFLNTVDFLHRFKFSEPDNGTGQSEADFQLDILNGKINCDVRNRMHSLPSTFGLSNNEIDWVDNNVGSCLSFRKFKKSVGLLRQTFGSRFSNLNAPEEDDVFNDSVFIEAHHIASKIADGSILETSATEPNILDSTPQPMWDNEILYDVEENIKCTTEDVFKTVDKMLPPGDQDHCGTSNFPEANKQRQPTDSAHSETNKNNAEISTNKSNHTSNSTSGSGSNNCSSLSREDCIQNLSGIFNGNSQKLSESRSSHQSNKSRSRDARDILNNLSVILCNENRGNQEKAEGQNLLFSLADILCSNQSENCSKDKDSMEDSGHSSIEVEQEGQDVHMCYEVLDLSTKRSTSVENPNALDMSMKKKAANSRHLSQSFNFPSPKLPAASNNNLKNSRNCSKESTGVKYSRSISASSLDKNVGSVSLALSNDTKSLSNLSSNLSKLSCSGKLKPKKIDDKAAAKRGPLKAVIPVNNMSKLKSNSTPKKNQSLIKNKRSSTPILEPKLLPVAQSTPDGISENLDRKKPLSCSTQLRKRKFECPVSPLARPTSIGDISNSELSRSNRSGSAPNISNSPRNASANSINTTMNRRKSASDLKPVAKQNQFKRSYSIGKEGSGISSSLSRVRESISKVKSGELASKKVESVTKIASKIALSQNRPSLGPCNRSGSNSSIKPFNLMSKLRCSTGKENAGH